MPEENYANQSGKIVGYTKYEAYPFDRPRPFIKLLSFLCKYQI